MGSGCAAGTGEQTTSPNSWGAAPGILKVVLATSCARAESLALPAGNFAASFPALNFARNIAANGDHCCGAGESKDAAPETGDCAGNAFELDTACIQSSPRATAPGDRACKTPQQYGFEWPR